MIRLTFDMIQAIVKRIKYKDWHFRVEDDRDSPWLQCIISEHNSLAETVTMHHGRKWRLSYHMTVSEVVQTALLAVLTAEEHEAREHFTYRGRKVFGPHIDVDVLWNACEELDIRRSAPLSSAEVVARADKLRDAHLGHVGGD